MGLRFALLFAALASAPALAQAQSTGDDISFKVDKERPTKNLITVAAIGGAAAVFTGVGILFNLDSRNKSDEINAGGMHTGLVWTPDREDTRESAIRSRNIAIVNYSIGGALALATAIYYIATDPGEELVTVPPGSTVRRTSLSFTDGGAVVGTGWSF